MKLGVRVQRSGLVREGTAGIALVVVLAFLALVSVLILGFFASVQTELTTSRAYASSTSVKQLADTATQVVMGQITDGTAGYEVPGTPGQVGSGRRLAWAMQPGLLRTYDDQGVPGSVYKLYSSRDMVFPRSRAGATEYNAISSLNTEVPSNWPAQTALYTDLNQPALVPDASGEITLNGQKFRADYPILDPKAAGIIEGFKIVNPPGSVDGENPAASSETGSSNRAPMPVQWLYVLADGTLSSPTDGTNVATWTGTGTSVPTAANPIVGRIAFWTDDETCKLNLNTAGEGAFWDRPWAAGTSEKALADNIPRQNEYTRYNGHPALTCLSPAFPFYPIINPGSPTVAELSPYLGTTANAAGSGIAPRLANPGSVSTTTGVSTVALKNERLFATVDELVFRAPFLAQRVALDSSRIDRDYLEKAKFFLTANSRAPELNLAGKPRITLWPLQVTERNVKDQLIAFCGTGNGSPYYFQRASKYSGDGRVTQTVPTPSSQDSTQDWVGVTRNRELMTYLKTLTDTSLPGFSGNFQDKYKDDRDQILTEMFDYVRSSLNSYNSYTALTPKYDYLPARDGYPRPGETQAIPIRVQSLGTMGFGRYATVTEAAIVFFQTVDDATGKIPMLQAYMLLEPFNPVTGPASWSPHMRYAISGLEQFSAGSKSLLFRPLNTSNLTPRNLFTARVGYVYGGHSTAFMGLQATMHYFNSSSSDPAKTVRTAADKTAGKDDEEKYYPFISEKIPLPAGPWDFSGGTINIYLYSGYDAAAAGGKAPTPSQQVQEIQMNFPPCTALPVPTVAETNINNRLASDYTNIIRSGDVVRSVRARADGATRGDLRLQTAIPVVTANYFAPHPQYNSSDALAHSLRTSGGDIAYLRDGNGAGGKAVLQTRLVKDLEYPAKAEPAAAKGLNGAFMSNGSKGDWDNGVGPIEDGAYINKADEGNVATGDGGYFSRGSFNVEKGETFAPNRQIASAINFGSLPTGVKRTRQNLAKGDESGYPWQTLVFCRYPASGDQASSHPGRGFPRDHLFLDLFTMPIVEPYAISEPFSTAGKVNLNYQIAPFTYLERSTALRGVLKSTRIMGIPTTAVANYKTGDGNYRYALDLDETLRGFQNRFALPASASSYAADAGTFRSASEICDMYLVPKGQKLENMAAWWAQQGLTGDNAREYPYGQIYPRVTVRSNTFTVHVRVQVLKKAQNGNPAEWNEKRDQVLSEYRGSTLIERYVDPKDPSLPDFAVTPNATMDSYYKFRVVGTKKFAP